MWMEDQLHIDHGTIPQIALEYFGKRQICVRFVSHSLVNELILPSVKCFLLNQSMMVSSHPPYSPDLMQGNSSLFHKKKILAHIKHKE
jgi:hypothetical protein